MPISVFPMHPCRYKNPDGGGRENITAGSTGIERLRTDERNQDLRLLLKKEPTARSAAAAFVFESDRQRQSG